MRTDTEKVDLRWVHKKQPRQRSAMASKQSEKSGWPMWIALLVLVGSSGCVERRLTINTEPQGAVIWLNNEDTELGVSPVETSFKWYGDFFVKARKQGFETLHTHRELKAPWYDRFPFDFFAQVLNPHQIVDSYEWTFELTPYTPKDRAELVSEALDLKQRLETQQESLP